MNRSNSDNSTYDAFVFWKDSALGFILTFTVALTIVGNILVVLAVLRERHMRANLTYRFLVSLAVADLLMGSVVMPFEVFRTINDGDWPFGRQWCDFWHAFDVLSSTASILNLCAIAVERFWATENPINYASTRTRKRCSVMLVCVWICSLLISFPGIAWWRMTDDYIADDSRVCNFTTNRIYLICSSMVSFYIPLVVMTAVYIRIYRTAANLIRSFRTGEKVVSCDPVRTRESRLKPSRCFNASNYKPDSSAVNVIVLRVHRGGASPSNLTLYVPKENNLKENKTGKVQIRKFRSHSQRKWTEGCCTWIHRNRTDGRTRGRATIPQVEPDSFLRCVSCLHSQERNNTTSVENQQNFLNVSLRGELEDGISYSNLVNRAHASSQPSIARLIMNDNPESGQSRAKQWVSKLRTFAATTRISKFIREQKAAKTLGLVMGLFIGCWLPFFICNIIIAFQPDLFTRNPGLRHVGTVVTWLGYINSSINPIIYARSMREFRRAFNRLLFSWWLDFVRRKHRQLVVAAKRNGPKSRSNNNVRPPNIQLQVISSQQQNDNIDVGLIRGSCSALDYVDKIYHPCNCNLGSQNCLYVQPHSQTVSEDSVAECSCSYRPLYYPHIASRPTSSTPSQPTAKQMHHKNQHSRSRVSESRVRSLSHLTHMNGYRRNKRKKALGFSEATF